MSDPYVASIPLVSKLGSILSWLLFINALLIGAVVLLAYKVTALRQRVRELEQQLDRDAIPQAPAAQSRSQQEILADDKPIPIVR
jgi:hypothetical protein